MSSINQKRYADYLGGEHWEELRLAALRRDEFKCVRCGRVASEVHHRIYRKTPYHTRLCDLASFCSVCHGAHHSDDSRMREDNKLLIERDKLEARLARMDQKRVARMKREASIQRPLTENQPWKLWSGIDRFKGRLR